MTTPIRQLLASAQAAENSGDVPRAVAYLREAAAFYQQRDQTSRAQQMLRQIRRLEGENAAVPTFGFGDELIDGRPPVVDDEPELNEAQAIDAKALEFERVITLAEPNSDSWCSFCCRPQSITGRLAAGPAGAFVCAECAANSVSLIGGHAPTSSSRSAAPTGVVTTGSISELGAQRAARARLQRSQRLALVLGAEGSGKSHLLKQFGVVSTAVDGSHRGSLQILDLGRALSSSEEAQLLQWLDAQQGRRVLLAVRAQAPEPALVLKSTDGEERIYDSEAIAKTVAHAMSAQLSSRVDTVVALATPHEEELQTLARALLESKKATLPQQAVQQLVQLSIKSGRGLHELAALISRVPSGQWE